MTQVLPQALAAHTGSMSNRAHFAGPTPAAIIHGIMAWNPERIQTSWFLLVKTYRGKVSGQGKATLLLCQPLSKLLGQSHSSITLSGLHAPVYPVVARCKAQGQESHPFQQPPTIHHIKLHPQHTQNNFLYGISSVATSRFTSQRRRQDVLGEKLVPREVVKGRGQGTQKAD